MAPPRQGAAAGPITPSRAFVGLGGLALFAVLLVSHSGAPARPQASTTPRSAVRLLSRSHSSAAEAQPPPPARLSSSTRPTTATTSAAQTHSISNSNQPPPSPAVVLGDLAGAPRMVVASEGVYHNTIETAVAQGAIRDKLLSAHNRSEAEDERCRRQLDDGSSAAVVAARRGLVFLDCSGQWGNRLGEYVLARVLAEELGFGLRVCPILTADNYQHGTVFPNANGLDFDKGTMRGLPIVRYRGHGYPVADILADRRPRVVHIDGYPFRNAHVYTKYHDRIRTEWLRPDESCLGLQHARPGANDVVIHLRAYHACSQNASLRLDARFVDLPLAYYQHILDAARESDPWERLWVCSRCGAKSAVFQQLQRDYGAQLAPEPNTEWSLDVLDWHFLRHAQRLIMSQSTYAWWAAFLGNAREVHYPLVGDWWGHTPRHTLYPVDDPRFHFHDVVRGDFFLSHDDMLAAIARLSPVVSHFTSSPARNMTLVGGEL